MSANSVTFRFCDGSELPLYRADVSDVENDRMARAASAKAKQLSAAGLSTHGKIFTPKRRARALAVSGSLAS